MPSRAHFAAAAALAGAAAGLTAATAGDRSLTGSVSQSFTADSNVQLEEDGGPSVGSITAVALRYADVTPSASLNLATGFTYTAFTGRENEDISGLFPTLGGSYAVNRPTQSLSVSFSGSVRPVDFFSDTGFIIDTPGLDDGVDVPDPGDGEEIPEDDPEDDVAPPGDDSVALPDDVDIRRESDETLRVSLSLGAGWNRRVNTSNSLSLSGNLSRTDFLDGDGSLAPSTGFSLGGGWNRVVASDASIGVNAGVSLFLVEDVSQRRSLSVNIGPSLSYSPAAGRSLSFSLGPAFTLTSRDVARGSERVEEMDTAFSLAGSAAASWTDRINTVSASATQSVRPADEGALVNATSLRLALQRRVSASSSVSVSGAASYQTALNASDDDAIDDRFAFTASTGFTYRLNDLNSATLGLSAIADDENDSGDLTGGLNAGWSRQILPELSANLGYGLRYAPDRDEAISHRVTLTLSRPFTLLR